MKTQKQTQAQIRAQAKRDANPKNWPAWKRDGYKTAEAYKKDHEQDRKWHAFRNRV